MTKIRVLQHTQNSCVNKIVSFIYGCCCICLVTLGCYLIVKDANWIFGDDQEFWMTTAINKFFSVKTHIGNGRFYPLSHYDYNILLFLPLGKTVLAHYLWVALSFIVLSVFLIKILHLFIHQNIIHKKFVYFLNLIGLFCIFCHPSFVFIFSEIIFPERLLIVLFSVFIYFYLSALSKCGKWRYFIAFLCAFYASYMKEPVSGMFLVLAVTNMLFNFKKMKKEQKIFYCALMLNFVVYMVVYYFLVFRNSTSFYNQGHVSLSTVDMIKGIFLENKVLFLIFGLGIFRGIRILFYRDYKHLPYDALLFMAMAYVFAYILLHLNDGYYFMPAIVIGWVVIFYWIFYCFEKKSYVSFLLLGCCLISMVLNYSSTKQQYLSINDDRRIFMPKMTDLITKYDQGNFKYWDDVLGHCQDFNEQVVNWQKNTLNSVANYLKSSNDVDYYSLVNNTKELSENDIIIYSKHNKNTKHYKQLNNWLLKHEFGAFLSRWGLVFYEKIKLPLLNKGTYYFSKSIPEIIITGLSAQENWGRWSDGDTVSLKFVADAQKSMKVSFDISVLLVKQRTFQNIAVVLNGKEKATWKFEMGKEPPITDLTIYSNEIAKDGFVKIDFEIENPQSPLELGVSSDTRKLAIGFKSMTVEELND